MTVRRGQQTATEADGVQHRRIFLVQPLDHRAHFGQPLALPLRHADHEEAGRASRRDRRAGEQLEHVHATEPQMLGEGIRAGDAAMLQSPVHQLKGGIDLVTNNVLSIQNNRKALQFNLDPAMFAKLQNAPGFVPVIINIRPMTNLRQFLDVD